MLQIDYGSDWRCSGGDDDGAMVVMMTMQW